MTSSATILTEEEFDTVLDAIDNYVECRVQCDDGSDKCPVCKEMYDDMCATLKAALRKE